MKHMGWHFLPADGCLRYGDGRKVEPGQVLTCEGDLSLCRNGMHHSVKILDALGYAPGPVICRTQLTGEVIHGHDKSVGRSRRCLWMLRPEQGEAVLRHFARACALGEIEKWKAPHVVIRYLLTGQEEIREAARAAAWAARAEAAWAARAEAAAAARAEAAAAARAEAAAAARAEAAAGAKLHA